MIQFRRWNIDYSNDIDDLNTWIKENGIDVVDFKMIDEYRVLISYRVETVQDDVGRFIEGFRPQETAVQRYQRILKEND